MWILPKQLHTCHFVQVMTESESDLKEFYQTCEQSLMWRSKPSQSQTWSRRWKANSWMQHLSTRMLRPSHTKSFVEKYLSYQEDSLVNPLVMLELEKELKTLDIYTHTSVEESKNVNQELFSSKMLKELSAVKQQTENPFSTMCLKTWKDWVTKQRQEYSLRVKSASHIREKESSSWGTPTLDSTTERTKKYSQGGKPLTLAVKEVSEKNWSTPTTGRADQQMSPSQLKRNSLNLAQQAEVNEKNWATPNTMDTLPARTPEKLAEAKKKGGCKNLREEVMSFPTPSTSDEQKYRLKGNSQATRCLSALARKGELQNYPTPQVDDSKNVNPSDKRRKTLVKEINTNQSQDQTNNNTNGKSLVLNPSWVEQLMGLTVGWTDCVFSEME